MARPDRFLLHVGLNKTGTSSLQTMLAANRDALARAGWIYPDFECTYHAHHKLAYALSLHRRSLGLQGNWQERLAALTADDDRRYLFSSELFFRVANPELVARHFPPEQTRVVVYLRNHLGYMASWYAQAVQESNFSGRFAEFAHTNRQLFLHYLQRWQRIYGTGRVTVRVFDRDRLLGGDVRRDFLSLLEGVDPAGIVFPETENNASISGNLLFFKRVLNNYMTYSEAYSAPIPDEFGAYAYVKDSFRGRFAISADEAAVVAGLFRADRAGLAGLGVDLGPEPAATPGLAVPDLATLDEDVRRIKQIAEQTGKKFLAYARRWQDWNRL